MIDKTETAFPIMTQFEIKPGITKREYFIGQVLAGICAHPEFSTMSEDTVASLAINQADALIELLKEEKK